MDSSQISISKVFKTMRIFLWRSKRLQYVNSAFVEKFGNRDYLLAMDYVTLNDDAEFTVVAKNLMGEARTACNLMVEPKGEGTDSYVLSYENKS